MFKEDVDVFNIRESPFKDRVMGIEQFIVFKHNRLKDKRERIKRQDERESFKIEVKVLS